MAEALGVQPKAIGMSLARGGFPPAWYPVIRDLCAVAGVECSDEAFKWRLQNADPCHDGGEV